MISCGSTCHFRLNDILGGRICVAFPAHPEKNEWYVVAKKEMMRGSAEVATENNSDASICNQLYCCDDDEQCMSSQIWCPEGGHGASERANAKMAGLNEKKSSIIS